MFTQAGQLRFSVQTAFVAEISGCEVGSVNAQVSQVVSSWPHRNTDIKAANGGNFEPHFIHVRSQWTTKAMGSSYQRFELMTKNCPKNSTSILTRLLES